MRCLTDYQFPSLNSCFNLSDAHARQSYKYGLKDIVGKFSEYFIESENENYHQLLLSCFREYLKAAGQDNALKFEFIVAHTASQSMEITANYLRKNNFNCCLIEPTFDNIPDILKRHQIELLSISEQDVENCSFPEKHFDSMFLTLPNNPTGFILSESSFLNITDYCRKNKILLIIDACFRLFDERIMYDWYSMLDNMKFIVIEDTGKIWPTQDLKTSFVIADHNTILQLVRISRDFLLNVSPFTLKIITEVIKKSKANNFKDYRELLKENKTYLLEKIKDSEFFEIASPNSNVSVELLKIKSDIAAPLLVDKLSEAGIGILPGTPFFWNNKELGNQYVRIALARNNDYFKNAIEMMFVELNNIYNGK